jgi:peptidoglycan-N-acetylglucosamine deacetylase
MSLIVHRVPRWVQWMYPTYIWRMDGTPGKVYLTFDDGPVPACTSFVLEELGKRNMKATFFMVGDNVRKHGKLAKEVWTEGHQIGNHTYHHIKGTETSTCSYLKEVRTCQEIIEETLSVSPKLFRPPYGRLKRKQAKLIGNEYKIVMWEVLSGDFANHLDPAKAIEKTMHHTRSGSIVLFHDQEKTLGFLKKSLPPYLDFILDKGFRTAWI